MKRLKSIIILAFACCVLAACEGRNDALYREILTSGVWAGPMIEKEVIVEYTDIADIAAEAEATPDADMVLYVFEAGGVMSVYEPGELPCRRIDMVGYTYSPAEALITIEGYGEFTVEDISVDMLRLTGPHGSFDLSFWGDNAILEE